MKKDTSKKIETNYEEEKILKEIKTIYREKVESYINKNTKVTYPEITYTEFYEKVPEISLNYLEKYIKLVEKEKYHTGLFGLFLFKKEKYHPELFGLFLSALINKTVEKYPKEASEITIRINVKNLPEPPSYLGYINVEGCHLIIEGDCGDNTGFKMQGGQITVEGNCGDQTGYRMDNGLIEVEGDCGDKTGSRMQGGQIKVEGSCGDDTGDRMQGGQIEVKGDCGENLGLDMKGGKIVVHGSIKSIAESTFSKGNKGEIWRQGKRIWPK